MEIRFGARMSMWRGDHQVPLFLWHLEGVAAADPKGVAATVLKVAGHPFMEGGAQ
jgi:hypothetical protein